MSFDPTRGRLLETLKGKTVTFVVDDRQTNMLLARFFLSQTGATFRVLDLDALYSSCADFILRGDSERGPDSAEICVPLPGAQVEPLLAAFLDSSGRYLIVDSVNTMNHILSLESRRARGRSLAFMMAAFAAYASAENACAILTMYQRGWPTPREGYQLHDMSDASVSVKAVEGGLLLTHMRGLAWADGVAFVSIP